MNLFELKLDPSKESLDVIHQGDGIRIERIISTGQSSPEGFWYDQDENEWVCLLQGEATLEYHDGRLLKLAAGDSIFIPAHQKHRVHSTSATETSLWLVIFYPQ